MEPTDSRAAGTSYSLQYTVPPPPHGGANNKTTSRAKGNNKIADRLAAPNSAPLCGRRAATSGAVRRQLAHTRRVAALSLLVASCTICTATQYRPRHSFLPETDA